MILLINTSSEIDLGMREFVSPVQRIVEKNGVEAEIAHFKDYDLEKKVERAQRVILCGSYLKDFEFLEEIERFDWLKGFKGSVLGICAGSEIIASVFGGEIRRGCEIGMREIRVVRENKLVKKMHFEGYCLHCLMFELGSSFEILARSNESIELFKVFGREIYGVVFHPEVRNDEVITNFLLEG